VGEEGTHNVKFLTENETKTIMPHTRPWATARKACTLTVASASGCRAFCRIHSVPFSMALGVLLLVISLLAGGIIRYLAKKTIEWLGI